MITKE